MYAIRKLFREHDAIVVDWRTGLECHAGREPKVTGLTLVTVHGASMGKMAYTRNFLEKSRDARRQNGPQTHW